MQVGDTILYFDDKYQHDFTKITLAVALAGPGQTKMYVRRADGTEETLLVTPRPGTGREDRAGDARRGPFAILRGVRRKKAYG